MHISCFLQEPIYLSYDVINRKSIVVVTSSYSCWCSLLAHCWNVCINHSLGETVCSTLSRWFDCSIKVWCLFIVIIMSHYCPFGVFSWVISLYDESHFIISHRPNMQIFPFNTHFQCDLYWWLCKVISAFKDI